MAETAVVSNLGGYVLIIHRSLLVVALGASACSGQSDAGTIQPGASCTGADAGCANGTTCLTESVSLAGGCSSMAKICTVTCTDDHACVALLGSGAHCTASCDGSQSICVRN